MLAFETPGPACRRATRLLPPSRGRGRSPPNPSPSASLPPVDVLIVGASARAAAFSALRAGMLPGAVDRFGDRDPHAVARCVRGPPEACAEALLEAADDFPACPWLYTGGLENR